MVIAVTLKAMPAEVVPGAGSMPRRARHLIPTQLPRRGEVIAACAVLILLAHLLFAQLTLALAVTFAVVSKVSRWRRWWLAVPAAVGLAWVLAVGPRAAAAGFTAGPAQILGYLSSGGHPLSRLLQPHGAFAGVGSWLPRQLPLALVAGAAEAALVGWLDWVHTDEWAVPAPRPGAFAAARSAVNRDAIRGGAVVTRDGCALGVEPATGARVMISWAEAAGGVLVTGAAAELVTITGFQVVHAALRRHKPVIAIDMTGDPAVARAMAGVCAAAGGTLRIYGGGEGQYEPFRHAGPARRLALALALLGIEAADQSQDGVPTYLRTVFEVMDAVPADPRIPVFDDVVHLLNPLALQARLRLVPGTHPRRVQLADLVLASARTAEEGPQALQAAGRRLADAGRQSQGSGAAGGGIDLAQVVRDRSAALFRLDAPPLARLVCADIAAVGEDLRGIGVDGDGLVWLHGCESSLSVGILDGLVTGGAGAGLPVLLSATEQAAADVAGMMNALLIHGLSDAAAAASLADRTGSKMAPASPAGEQELVPRPAVAPRVLLSLAPARFVLAVKSPRRRLVSHGQLVPARLPLDAAGDPARGLTLGQTRGLTLGQTR
jgi:hypothetical protein